MQPLTVTSTRYESWKGGPLTTVAINKQLPKIRKIFFVYLLLFLDRHI